MGKYTPSFEEFQDIWMRCIEAMNSIVANYGHSALTFENVSKYSGIPIQTLEDCFFTESKLQGMYDKLNELTQSMRLLIGKERLN